MLYFKCPYISPLSGLIYIVTLKGFELVKLGAKPWNMLVKTNDQVNYEVQNGLWFDGELAETEID